MISLMTEPKGGYMPHLSVLEKIEDFDASTSSAMVWFLSGVALLLFVMLLGLIFMG